MAKMILICGKICSGKTYYARQLRDQYNAVILSTDEVTWDLINNEQGEFYDVFAEIVNLYLRKKAVEIIKAGANVVLDWGFWTAAGRKEISDFLRDRQVEYEWHFIDIPDNLWYRNIGERNRRITEGKGGTDFYVDEGLLQKLLGRFEKPERNEMDVWFIPEEH